MSPVTFTLPMCPSTNHLFFTRLKGRSRTPEYNQWITEAGWEIVRQRVSKVKGRVSLLIEVEEPKTKHRRDVTNRIKAVEDLLVSHNIIEGDHQAFVRSVTAEWNADIEGVRVTITPIQEQAEAA